jgi:hypothetical protein
VLARTDLTGDTASPLPATTRSGERRDDLDLEEGLSPPPRTEPRELRVELVLFRCQLGRLDRLGRDDLAPKPVNFPLELLADQATSVGVSAVSSSRAIVVSD